MQEILRKHNDPRRTALPTEAGPASLWHAMQQREDPGSDGSEGSEQATPLGQEPWLEDGSGGLFSSGHAPTSSPAWQHAQPDTAHVHNPRDGLGRQASQQQEVSGEDVVGQQDRTELAVTEAASAAGPAGRLKSSSVTGPDHSEPSNSMMGNLMSTMRSASDTAASADGDTREDLKRDILLAHMLSLLTQQYMPAHALPALAAYLTDKGVMPQWVQVILTQQPALFDRVFQKLFTEEIAEAAESVSLHALAANKEEPAAWAFQRLWDRRGGQAASLVPKPRAATASSQGLSRYETDFQELRTLGKGGYGLVVAAVNRLDGRQYAVKKIRMPSAAPVAYSRLMREVSTLARLQHPHVVRYFQAWCEAGSGDMPLDAEPETDSELGDWLGQTSESQPHLTPSLHAPSFSVRHKPLGLDPVQEASSEGYKSSAPVGRTSSHDDDSESTAPGAGFWQTHTSATAETSRPEPSKKGTGRHSNRPDAEPPPGVQMLYIQMEFCPRTLREVLDRGPLSPEDCWQVLRQLLAGLAHIHAQGIIHRDLKPANIFYDARGDIKLGDFGLAKFASAAEAEAHDSSATLSPGTATEQDLTSGDRTGTVGTSFYISPEVAKGWAVYDDRVDVFSLGIVAFELWHPFSTGMERVAMLKNLQEHGALPAEWAAANPKVAELITWLTAANPRHRPSMREVLRSELLPPTVGDEQLTDLLRSLPDNAEAYDRVVDSIFNMPVENLRPEEVPGTPNAFQVSARQAILETLESVFARHGAVPMDSSDIGFCPVDPPPDVAALLSTTGARLAMRYELRAPFAAWLARQAESHAHNPAIMESMRRYEVAWVRRRGVGRALPKAHLQADLDIATLPGSSPSETLLADAEVIRAVSEVMDALPDWIGELEVRLGHRALLEAALVNARVPKELRGSALQLLATGLAASPRVSGARSEHWPSIKIALEGLGLPAGAVSACKIWLLQVPGDAEAALHRLQTKLLDVPAGAKRASREVQGAIESLKIVTGHLAAWNLPKYVHVTVEPFLRPHADYYSGAAFQVNVVHPMTGASSLIAVGGRYDGLIRSFWPPSQWQPMGAVGTTLNVERLISLASPQNHPGRSTLQASQAEVLVCAKGGGGLLKERKALAALLWEAGIKAELVHAAAPSQTFQYEWAAARNIHWLVTIHAVTFSTTDTVQVKNLERRTEEDVAYTAIAKYLTSVLPRFQQMHRRDLALASQEELEDDLTEDSRQEGRGVRRYGRRHSERR
ncbi:hypothetical protein CVIRNUC_002156 [Coccomyxa viridis]|uniref:non-specific serine/threonine protein kinase n=1 Tax=Coccomyxa viridis TaxID=1274662 RepID=A0AAV1HZB7_9CHLO|nr:hypothetical protein CVIRNUC_002156 [Coccomyxa viridis]